MKEYIKNMVGLVDDKLLDEIVNMDTKKLKMVLIVVSETIVSRFDDVKSLEKHYDSLKDVLYTQHKCRELAINLNERSTKI